MSESKCRIWFIVLVVMRQCPDVDGPVHAYMRSAPGCWQLYGEVLAREYGRGGFGSAHRLTVDAYAHPAPKEPGSPQPPVSRAASHEPPSRARAWGGHVAGEDAIGEHAERHRGGEFPWLEPPASFGQLTVLSVHAAHGPEEHVERVSAWAASVWNVWSEYHARVRGWLDGREIR